MPRPPPSPLVLYTIVGCPQCNKARRLLHDHGIPYREVSLDEDAKARADLSSLTAPQLFSGARRIGGYDAILTVVKEGSLRRYSGSITMADVVLRSQSALLRPPRDQNGNDSGGGVSSVSTLSSAGYAGLLAKHGSFESSEGETSSIPDELFRLLADMKKANFIRDNRVGLVRVYRNSFKGSEFVDWVMREREMSRKEALELGQELIDRHLGQQSSKEAGDTFSPDRYYQLVEDDENKPLNTGDPPRDEYVSVREFNDSLCQIIQPIYDEICENKVCHYYKLIENENFARYLVKCRQLQKVKMSEATTEERLALFINVYNMLVIHITQKYGPSTSVWQRRKFFNTTYYHIDGHNYALQSIFNGILRSNRKGKDMLWKSFGKQDQRLPLIMPECDPLIHFALSTAERSSPPLRAYTVDRVREQLREQASILLGSDEYVRVDVKKNTILVSKIFKWFAEDFGCSNAKIVEFISELMDREGDREKRAAIQRMHCMGEYKVDFLHHDTTFNGVERNERPSLLPTLDCRPRAASDVDFGFGIPQTPSCY